MPKRLAPTFFGLISLIAPALGAAEIPRQAPGLAIRLNSSKQVLLGQYEGKVVAVAFILTYCPHCQKTVGVLSKMQNELGGSGFQALASAIEDMAAMAVPDFIKRFGPPFPTGFNGRNAVLEFLQHPSTERLLMPQLVFVDRKGMIRAQYSGDDEFFAEDKQEDNIRAAITGLLKEQGDPRRRAVRNKR